MLKEQHQRELKELEERLLQQVQPVGKKKTEKKSLGEEEDMTQKRGPVLEERLLQQVKSVNRSTAEQQHHARNSTVMPANWNKYTDDTYNRNYYVNEKVDQKFFVVGKLDRFHSQTQTQTQPSSYSNPPLTRIGGTATALWYWWWYPLGS